MLDSTDDDPCDFCERKFKDFGLESDCEKCPRHNVSPEDLQAWELYQAINSQFVYDFHGLPLVFEIFDIRCTRQEARELLERLSIIHDLVTKHSKAHGA